MKALSKRLNGLVSLTIPLLSSLLYQSIAIAQPWPTAEPNPTIKLKLEKPQKKNGDSQELLCLDSGNECIEQLTEKAIANSSELVILNQQIALIDKRLEVAEKRIEHTSKKRWTNYLSTDPLRIAANVFGGGDVQRDNIAIANLEVRSAELEAYRANLHRRQAEVRSELREEVFGLVLEYEAAEREYVLAQSKLDTYNQQRQLIEIDYQFGSGSTTQMLSLWQQGKSLEAEIMKIDSQRGEIVRKLQQITGMQSPTAQRKGKCSTVSSHSSEDDAIAITSKSRTNCPIVPLN